MDWLNDVRKQLQDQQARKERPAEKEPAQAQPAREETPEEKETWEILSSAALQVSDLVGSLLEEIQREFRIECDTMPVPDMVEGWEVGSNLYFSIPIISGGLPDSTKSLAAIFSTHRLYPAIVWKVGELRLELRVGTDAKPYFAVPYEKSITKTTPKETDNSESNETIFPTVNELNSEGISESDLKEILKGAVRLNLGLPIE